MPYGCIRAYHDPCGTVALACVTLAHAQCDMANRKAKWVRESVSLTLFSFGEPQPLATMGAMISRCCRDDDGVESDPLREPLEPAQLSGPCRAFRLNTKATAFGDQGDTWTTWHGTDYPPRPPNPGGGQGADRQADVESVTSPKQPKAITQERFTQKNLAYVIHLHSQTLT